MGQEHGEKWTAAAELQTALPKPDRLLGARAAQATLHFSCSAGSSPRNLKLEADLATLRERPSAADDFAGGVQQSLDEVQQRMANMRNSTSNFAVREFELEASVFVQVTPLGSVEYRFVHPGEQAPAQASSKLSLQVVPVPKDNLAGV